MKTSAFLNAIWRGDVVAEGQAGQAWFTEALSRFIPVPWAVFVNKTGKGRLEVFVDDHEIEPGLSLGDVLCEELESELPYGSLIVLQPEGVGEASLTAGLIVAEALVGAVSQGLVPLDEETSSLYALACAADARAEEVTLEGFEPLAFRAGLARGLSRYWFGDESVTGAVSALPTDRGWLTSPRTLAVLAAQDAAFWSPSPEMVSSDLLGEGEPTGYFQWFAETGAVLADIRDLAEREMRIA